MKYLGEILVYVTGDPQELLVLTYTLIMRETNWTKVFCPRKQRNGLKLNPQIRQTITSLLALCAGFTLYYHLITFRLQITNWLQGLFIFAMVWSIGGTINGDSRKKFDAFFRLLISGTDKDHPKPNNIKMTKVKKCCYTPEPIVLICLLRML